MSDNIDFNSAESWANAQRYLTLLGPIPSSINSAVKNLWKDHCASIVNGDTKISFGTYSSLRMIDKSSVLKMPLYFAAQSLYAERFNDINEDDATKATVQILGPGLYAALLSLVYMHRRFNKVCDQIEWQGLSKEYVLNSEIGFLLGQAAPSINEAVGALAGGVRTAAIALFLRHDPTSYKKYREDISYYDLTAEHQRWGCDHCQIAALILKVIGFGVDPFKLASAMRKDTNIATQEPCKAFKKTVLIIDAIKRKENIVGLSLPEDVADISSNEKQNIAKAITNLLQKGSNFNWMLRSSRSDELAE
jgi:hypothetical protein